VSGDSSIATGEVGEPVSKIDAEGDRLGHGCRLGFDHHGFLPCAFLLVEMVDPLDGDVLTVADMFISVTKCVHS
jgi:hypothetical protein